MYVYDSEAKCASAFITVVRLLSKSACAMAMTDSLLHWSRAKRWFPVLPASAFRAPSVLQIPQGGHAQSIGSECPVLCSPTNRLGWSLPREIFRSDLCMAGMNGTIKAHRIVGDDGKREDCHFSATA